MLHRCEIWRTGDRYISDITSASNKMWRMVTNWSDPEEQHWIVAGKVDISPYDYQMLSFNPSQHLCEILERSVCTFLSFGQKRVLWGATDHQIKKVLPSVQADIYAIFEKRFPEGVPEISRSRFGTDRRPENIKPLARPVTGAVA